MTMDPEAPVVRVSASARTDIGAVRERNEDAVRIGSLDRVELASIDGEPHTFQGARGPLLVVCDGMGGMAAGDVASDLAAETLWSEMSRDQHARERDVVARILRRAVRKANRALLERASNDPELRGMGTTASVAVLAGRDLVLAQVGDSRAYVWRAGELVQVTRDQSVVSALVAAGKLTESEARVSAHRSMILQALGAEVDVVVSLSVVELRREDRLLLCSDGLHGAVGDSAIADAVGSGSIDVASGRLVELAHQAGAPDNISVVVAEFLGEALEPAGDDDSLEFSELDPAQEGDEAITHTSKVAKKLAAKAGLIGPLAGNEIPATGMHPAIRRPMVPPDGQGPATQRWQSSQRVGLLAWIGAIVALLVALAWILLR